MRFTFIAMIAVLIALPLMAKAYDNNAVSEQAVQAATADMMAVIADMDQVVEFEPASAEVAAMAKALNDLTVGSVQ